MSDNSTDERVQKYIDYLTDTYIAEEAQFPPLTWASDRIEGEERTTNACEAFHSKFNANFSAPNPNIYAFVEVMNSVQLARNFPSGATRLWIKSLQR
ncbi:hypothetical protein AVEN_199597-1 [Araneus ventricosus]|uniref:Uncharacterized protein n=1 Tax=Araneus ventricosus TaxID=182803 RepID=A0A4Y2PFN2_ARAVE|nr:hypothetical protein AVEN_139039-1 [Araneus ventricosus]GBN49023.1 hypothetical protein AVEN_227319-1 [Araneus ventricosus]GBN77930.1 hypothetical protein AVEN_70054-1 [Araneus ventricosus]GBN77934.1 hypothetical protein AVEN_199597-1 [Araneus ventricosus]